MRRVAALLAAVLAGLAIAGCGGGAEPGAPTDMTAGATTGASPPTTAATLVLDFQPNAVHTGLYVAKARGQFANEALDLEIREPSGTADGAKLLEADKTDFAILDIADFEIAQQRGLDLAAVAAIVQRPLAALIAADGEEIETPADLDGKTVGVTGVPSDDVVVDTVLASAGLPPDAVKRQTIGFNAVPLLLAGELDAATAFWNAEGVELKREGAPTREFRVDEFGASRYPELVVATRREADPRLGCALASGLERGYEELGDDPGAALDDLLSEVPELDEESQRAQLDALIEGEAFPAQGVTPDGGGRVEFAGC